MEPQIELLELVAKAVENNCRLDTTVSLDELPADGGLYAELGDGFSQQSYFNKTSVREFPILFLSRCKSQKKCIGQLCAICNYLEKLKHYPNAGTFKWLDCTIAKQPTKIGRDEDGKYHYSCIVNCKIYY